MNEISRPKSSCTGYGKYLRFTLKHNLVRYLVWIAVVVGLLAYVTVFYSSQQETDPDFLDQFTNITSTGGMSALAGKISVISLAGAVWSKIWMFLAMTMAIGMVFQVTKGLRADEENGRTELFRSRPFGIHSTMLAVVSGALLLCALIGALCILTAAALGLDPAGAGIKGSVVFGLSIMACGFVGVGVGAFANQLSSSASLVNSTGSIIIAAFYALRVVGDMSASALVWISPIGWGEKMAPWAENRWWLVVPALVLTAALIAAALIIESRRDYGSGVLKEKSGKYAASPLMRRSWGLVLRLYRGSLIAWSAGIALSGLLFGSVANSMADLLKNLNLGMMEIKGVEATLSFLLVFIGLIAMLLPIQIITGLRSDEARGLTESQLSASVSRVRLVLERVVIALVTLIFLLMLGGLFLGLSYGAVVNEPAQALRLASSALVYVPSIMSVVGLVVLLFGFIPRATVPVTWFVYGVMYFDVLFGENLPGFVRRILPFTGTPRLPSDDLNVSVLGFALAAVVFTAVGIAGLRKRDVPKI